LGLLVVAVADGDDGEGVGGRGGIRTVAVEEDFRVGAVVGLAEEIVEGHFVGAVGLDGVVDCSI